MGTLDYYFKYQHSGILLKKQIGNQAKWTKRFFVLKDGFLLYYAESEKKELEKKRFFNSHPKVALPLSDCTIEARKEPGHPFSIAIHNKEITGSIVISAESEYERDKWLSVLQISTKVSWANIQLYNTLIEQLEVQGLKMAQEKQDYFDKLQSEVEALQDEKQRSEELETMNNELELEKQKMEVFAKELQLEHDRIKVELQSANDLMKNIEQNKVELHEKTLSLQHSLEELEKEKRKTLSELELRHSKANLNTTESLNQSLISETLQDKVTDIDVRTKQLLDEKIQAETKLREHEEKARLLEIEKNAIYQEAQELQESIKDLSVQKAITESELKEEILARIEAEKRLHEADISLSRLERAVNEAGHTGQHVTDEQKEEMTADVKTLKKFFENLAFEAKIEKEKPLMVRNTIHSRRSKVRRCKTMRSEKLPLMAQASMPNLISKSNVDVSGALNSSEEFYHFVQSSTDLVSVGNTPDYV